MFAGYKPLFNRVFCQFSCLLSLMSSKDLLHDWMVTRDMHFTKWTAAVKKKAIRQCGIGLAEYGNNTKRDEILQHLASTELPLNAGRVLATLNAAGFLHAGARSRQQYAYILLRNITPAGPLPVLYVKAESLLHITGPGRELLVKKAHDVLDSHLFLEDMPLDDLRPHTYRFEPSRQQLFDSRRRVCF